MRCLQRAKLLHAPDRLMQPPTLVDIGINLAHDSYDVDRAEVVERAVAAGVRRMVVTGSSIEATEQAIAVCRQWPSPGGRTSTPPGERHRRA